MGLDIGAFTYFLYAFNRREDLYDIFETLCGARFTNSYTRVGGVMHDATPLFVEMVRDVRPHLPQDARRHGSAAESQPHLRRSHQGGRRADEGRGHQPQLHRARSPAASGVTRDLRKDEPYLAYKDFDFQVCCATAGDCYARYLVRMAEMRESLKIVAQAIENLPAGPGERRHRRADRACPTKRQVYSTIEGLHLALRADDEQPRLRSAAARKATRRSKAPTASWASTSSATAADVAYRARCRPPSYIHFAVFPHLIRGHTLSDVVAVLGSLNIIAAELDR